MKINVNTDTNVTKRIRFQDTWKRNVENKVRFI